MTQRMIGLAGAAAALLTFTIVTPSLAWGPWIDPYEDRLDRAENRYDERHDNGRRDRIEDRADRTEDRLDRNGVELGHAFDRHERKSWRRIVTPE
jgi:hypothetical protein